jgi:hypothetical protein
MSARALLVKGVVQIGSEALEIWDQALDLGGQ